jgi:alkylation response protein AidB-like acyl-CoA dehydrogenase
VRFALDDDQLAFCDTVRDALTKECRPEVVRAAWSAAPGALDRGPWAVLAAMGVLGTTAPEAAGGLGLDEEWLVPLLTEAGRVALPHPLVATAAVAAPLRATGPLAELAPEALVTTDLGGPIVPCAADADVVLRFEPAGGASPYDAPGPADWSGRLAALDAREVELEPVETVDRSRRGARLVGAAGRGALVSEDPAVIGRAADRGALGTAGELVGLAEAMVAMTVDHVSDRHQFGAPVGSFQAVKHHLADAQLGITFARPAVARAAWSLAHDTATATRDVSMAKAMAGDAAEAAGRAALQCHGAIGYTVEHDLHLSLKRTWALARTWGDAAWHRARVADLLGL